MRNSIIKWFECIAEEHLVLITIALIQNACLLFAFLGDFGFDHPGKYGLDFGHLLLLGMIFVIITLIGFIKAIVKKKGLFILIFLIPPLGVLFIIYCGLI